MLLAFRYGLAAPVWQSSIISGNCYFLQEEHSTYGAGLLSTASIMRSDLCAKWPQRLFGGLLGDNAKWPQRLFGVFRKTSDYNHSATNNENWRCICRQIV